MPLCMVLDDNEVAREAASKVLSNLHLHPITMGDSAQALEFCKENVLEILILDIMMPKIDGVNFLKKLRKLNNGKKTYVIACSARNDEETVYKMTNAGVNDYILKPFDPEMLANKIKSSGLLE